MPHATLVGLHQQHPHSNLEPGYGRVRIPWPAGLVGSMGRILGVPVGSPPPCSPLTWSRRKYPGVKRLGRMIMAQQGAAGSGPVGQQQQQWSWAPPTPGTPTPETPTLTTVRVPASVARAAGPAAPSERAARTRRARSSCQPRSAPAAPPSAHAGAGGDGHRGAGGGGQHQPRSDLGRRESWARLGDSPHTGLQRGCPLPQFPHLQRKQGPPKIPRQWGGGSTQGLLGVCGAKPRARRALGSWGGHPLVS